MCTYLDEKAAGKYVHSSQGRARAAKVYKATRGQLRDALRQNVGKLEECTDLLDNACTRYLINV